MADPWTILFPFYEYIIANILMKAKTMGKTAESTNEKTHTPKTELIEQSVENIYICIFNILRELWRGIICETSSNHLEVLGIKKIIIEINRLVE